MSVAPLPAAYAWLAKEGAPRTLVEALAEHGVVETPGAADNPRILGWAKEVGLGGTYSDDAIPWCGLFMAVVAKRATWDVPANPLWARNWLKFGRTVAPPELGDVLVFERGTGGHVGLYVGEDAGYFHVLGGNQSDKVCISRLLKTRLLGARRPVWRIAEPANVRRVFLSSGGAPVSKNEA
jgi:uncharacterized protein (TIGR02594 family)